MKNKFLISTLALLAFAIVLCSYSLANNDMMKSAGNVLSNAGNAIGNAAIQTRDTIVGGTENLTNGMANLGNDNGMDGAQDTPADGNDDTTLGTNGNTDYTATRTATTDTGLFGMSDTLSTWVILGIVGAIIIGLIWYYGAQYEHKNYRND